MEPSPIQLIRQQFASGRLTPFTAAAEALSHVNGSVTRNTYVALDPERVMAEAAGLEARFPRPQDRPALYGLPISVKDCFKMEGYPTSCGSRFYEKQNGIAAANSALAGRLRAQGAVLIGKAHMHQLAYGITGENRDYGDCAQPGQPQRLTGGSSSGAAASVLEGSAIAGIGTDTGGSIRVPAALCGLAGYRATRGLGSWAGGAHLAPSFDTQGWLFRDLRDTPLLAAALLDLPPAPEPKAAPGIGVLAPEFLHDADDAVLDAFATWQDRLRTYGAQLDRFDSAFWEEAMQIYPALQAHEAAALHRGYFAEFEPVIAERLAWGESLTGEEVSALRARNAVFRERMDALFARFDFLIAPCAPYSVLALGVDHSQTRGRILRYTTPVSLCSLPVVTLPAANGGGVQLIAPRGHDAALVAFAARLGEKFAHRI